MGLALSLLQGGILLAYMVFTVVKAVLPRSFKAPRVGHTTLAVTMLSAAHVMGLPFFLDKLNQAHAYGQLKSVDLRSGCNDDFLHSCQGAQVVYRASSVLFLYFVLMATAGGAVHYIYANLWPLKFLAVAGGVGGMLFLPDPALFGVYAEVARVLSLGWMLFQGFLVLDFAHDVHDAIGAKAEEQDSISGSSSSIFSSWWRILYLVMSCACLAATGVGLATLFTGHVGCTLGASLAGITLAVGVVTTVLSLVESVGIGLLPPSILFAHSTFLCWYAMSSHPDQACNPYAADDVPSASGKGVGVVISLAILVATVAWITWHGEKVLELFGVEGEESISLLSASGRHNINTDDTAEGGDGEDAIESRPSRVFFCAAMASASCFAAMAMTSWARTDGSPESIGTAITPLESVWLKVASQWVCLLLQMRVLWVTYRENKESSSYRSF
ncbi:unnamed protein product [Ectocarpus sp. 13 AM-2016]